MASERRTELLPAGIFGVLLLAIVATGFPEHVDESVYLRAVRVFTTQPLPDAIDSYVAPVGPLQYLPLAAVASVFGDDLRLLRLVSVLVWAIPFAILTALTLRQVSRDALLVTAGVLASPYVFVTGLTIYSEPAALALGQAGLYFWVRAWREPDRSSIAPALGFAGLALLVRQFQLALLGAFLVPLVLGGRLRLRDVGVAVAVVLPALALFARWGGVVPPAAAPATASLGFHGKLTLLNLGVLGAYAWPTLFALGVSRARAIAAAALALATVLLLDASLPWGLHAHGLAVASSPLGPVAGGIVTTAVSLVLHAVGWAVVLGALSRLRDGDDIERLFAAALVGWLALSPVAGRTYERYVVTLLPVAAVLWAHRGLPRRVQLVWLGQMAALAIALTLRWTGRA